MSLDWLDEPMLDSLDLLFGLLCGAGICVSCVIAVACSVFLASLLVDGDQEEEVP